MLPMSREIEQLERLKRSLAVYRMVFGQPRQEDLSRGYQSDCRPRSRMRYMAALRIDLSPPRLRAGREPATPWLAPLDESPA